MTSIKSDLQKARNLIAKGWTQGAMARNRSGQSVAPADEAAVCWCLWGAFRATGAESNSSYPAYDFMKAHMDIPPIVFNDDNMRTQAEMLSLLDTMIETAP